MIFNNILHNVREKNKLEKNRKQSKIICDFIHFLKANDFKFFKEIQLENNTSENSLMPIELIPEQIDLLLIEFFNIYDKIRKDK